MKPVSFNDEVPAGWRKLELGKDQPEYQTLEALVSLDGQVITVWELEAEELAQLCTGGRLMLTTLTFNRPFQPVRLAVLGGERELRVGAGDDIEEDL